MRKSLFFLCLCIPVALSAQKFTFDDLTEGGLPADKQNVKLSTDFGNLNNTKQALKFTEQGSYVIFPGVVNPKEIRFDFLTNFVTEGPMNFVVSYRKPGSAEFTEFTTKGKISLNKGPSTQIFTEYFIPALKEGSYDIKLALETSPIASFYLDNLQFVPFDQKELDEAEKNRKFFSDATNITTKVITNNQVADYNNKVEIVKTGYVENIDQLRELSYRANVLASLSKLVVFVNQRTKMGDPSNYQIFNEKIDFVKLSCNAIQSNFLTRLLGDSKPKEYQVPDQANKRTGIMKFIQVAGEVGNIITGGKLKSIVNSIQGLVSSQFDPTYLRNKIPEVLTYMEGSKIKQKLNPDYDTSKISKLINDGLSLQSFFYSFFDKLEADSKEFSDLVAEFKYYSEKTDALLEEIELLRKDYFQKVKYNMSDDFYNKTFLAYKDAATASQIAGIKAQAASYFDNLKIPINSKGEVTGGEKEVRLADLDETINLNKRIIDLGKQYKLYASELKNLFSKVDFDLKKNNPFSKYDLATKSWIKDDAFKNSFDDYEKLKNNAEATFTSLKGNLEVVLN